MWSVSHQNLFLVANLVKVKGNKVNLSFKSRCEIELMTTGPAGKHARPCSTEIPTYMRFPHTIDSYTHVYLFIVSVRLGFTWVVRWLKVSENFSQSDGWCSFGFTLRFTQT